MLIVTAIAAFATYWLTGSHYSALEINLAFMSLTLIAFLAGGGRVR
jgi:hypothetical protein